MFRLVNIGRAKINRDVDCSAEMLFREVKKHLASNEVDIYWVDDQHAIVTAGIHKVGEILDVRAESPAPLKGQTK